MELNDEVLGAWLDGELDATQRARVEEALKSDPGARLRLERLQLADRALREALPLARFENADRVMAALQPQPAVPRRAAPLLPWALAASLAGVMVGYVLPRTANEPPVAVAAFTPQLSRVLDSAASGSVVEGVTVVLSFRDADARPCRLFRQDAPAGEGLACHDAGAWTLAAWDATQPEATGGFRPAGASALVDGAMSALGGSPAMTADQEAAAIRDGWRQR